MYNIFWMGNHNVTADFIIKIIIFMYLTTVKRKKIINSNIYYFVYKKVLM